MWKRHLLFLVVALGGLSVVVGGLLLPPVPPQAPAAATWKSLDGGQRVVNRIDLRFHQWWQEKGLRPAGKADSLTVIRRVSLGLTGTIPSLEELRLLESINENEKVDWWVSYLLKDRRSAEYIAERLARSFVGTENGPFILYRRRRFVRWLADQLAANRPYDQVALDLISGEGIWTDTPAVNFLTVTVSDDNQGRPDPVRLAGRTARAFLGMRIDCLQCHDDPMSMVELGPADDPRDGLQSDFHQLAAFYSDAKMSLLGLTDEASEYKTKYLGEDEEEVVPERVPYLAELLPGAGVKRRRLARWVTDPRNKPFARATVNRVWALMFGRPLVTPVDDIPLYGPFPPGLDALAEDFAAHQFDLHRLIQLIAATEVFQLDSRSTDWVITEAHDRHFASFPLVRLRPEQVAGALLQACSLRTINAEAHILAQLMRTLQQSQFVQRYGDMGEDEFEDRGGTVTQRLLLMNGNLLKERTKENLLLNAATRVAVVSPSDEKAVEVVYLTILTRFPTPREKVHFRRQLAQSSGATRNRAMEDLYWVLLNGSEFSWNH